MYNYQANGAFGAPMNNPYGQQQYNPMGTYYMGVGPASNAIPERNSLSEEELKILKEQKGTGLLDLNVTPHSAAKSHCMHQQTTFTPVGQDMIKCDTCGEIIYQKDYTQEEVERIVKEYLNLINALKIKDRILPDDIRRQIYGVNVLVEKIPSIYKAATEYLNNYFTANNIAKPGYYNGGRDAFNQLSNMMGGNRNYAMNGQPMMGNPYFNNGQPMADPINPMNINPQFNPMNQPMNAAPMNPMGAPQPVPNSMGMPQPQFGQPQVNPMGTPQPNPMGIPQNFPVGQQPPVNPMGGGVPHMNFNQQPPVNPMGMNLQGSNAYLNSPLNAAAPMYNPAPTGGINSNENFNTSVASMGVPSQQPAPQEQAAPVNTNPLASQKPASEQKIEINHNTGKPVVKTV